MPISKQQIDYESRSDTVSPRAIEGAPDLVVEITSPSNIFNDRNTKKKKYLEFGVKEYWIVDPINQTLEIYLYNQSHPEVSHVNLTVKGKATSAVLSSLEF